MGNHRGQIALEINANIYQARVQADGSLTSWTFLVKLPVSPTNLQPKPRYYSEALVRDGKLLVLGGRNETTVQGGAPSDDNQSVVWQLGRKAPDEEFSVVYHGAYVPATPPNPAVVNFGATVTWQFMGKTDATTSNLVVNSPFQIYLPTILK